MIEYKDRLAESMSDAGMSVQKLADASAGFLLPLLEL